MKAQGAGEDEIKAQEAKVRKASRDIAEFCEETGRTRRRDREYTPVNARFYNDGKNFLQDYGKSGILTTEMIENRRIFKNSELANGLPFQSTANTVSDKTDDNGKLLQRRVYGNDGNAIVDFDTTDHNRPDLHPTGAHRPILNCI